MNIHAGRLVPWLDSPYEVRLLLVKWLYREPIDHQFITYPKSGWLLWNYLRRVGIRAVATKVKSRLSEQSRNKKVAGIGIGRVVDLQDDFSQCIGRAVLFFAPNHSPNSQCLIVDSSFLVDLPSVSESSHVEVSELPGSLKKMVAWSRYSGLPVKRSEIQDSLKRIASNISGIALKNSGSTIVFTDRIEVPLSSASKPTAVLFGLGNYSKTAILPNIKNNLQLQRIHEIDPDQFRFLNANHSLCVDTSPLPRDGLVFDAWFIAGYHHTHAELAAHALRQGAAAVIEKPLATTRRQYDDFISLLNQCPRHRFYLCFHKRYSDLHLRFEKDFGVNMVEPIDMHCVVYEIPLPRFHWYNWPNSGSRLISNGCHWIDYFMFVNNYCEVEECRKWLPRGSDVVVQIKLTNGAYLSMSLTDSGSQRVGVREYIELRAKGQTFKMIDGEYYSAENRSLVFSKIRVNPLKAYARMYRKISKDIARGGAGDSLESLRSSDVTLILEEL